jgi:hypothetical protein
MTRFPDMRLSEAIANQIDLLAQGQPLAAFDAWFSPSGKMYANDRLFAADGAEARRKQEPFISAAREIRGKITDLNVDAANGLCVFRNQTRFSGADGVAHQIDGLCWQRWEGGQITEERYFDGALMDACIGEGVLEQSAQLLLRAPGAMPG